jgi:hypothetical protein
VGGFFSASANPMDHFGHQRRPRHWDLLNENDKAVYVRISAALSAPSSRDKRNRGVDDFKDVLDAIETFVNSDETDKWKRCLVCGLCPLSNGIAVNVVQLKRLTFKCKSSINVSLKRLGYDVVLAKALSYQELFQCLPQLKNNFDELRQWTVRMSTSDLAARRPNAFT